MDIIYKINKYTDKLKDLYIRENYNIDTYNKYATKLNYYYSIYGGGKEKPADKPADPRKLNLQGATELSSESDSRKAKKAAKNDAAKSGEANPAKPKLTQDQINANIAASQARKAERNAKQKEEGKAKAKEQKEELKQNTPEAKKKDEDENETEMRLDKTDEEIVQTCPELKDYPYSKIARECADSYSHLMIHWLENIKYECKKTDNKEQCEKCKKIKDAKLAFCRKKIKKKKKAENKDNESDIKNMLEKNPDFDFTQNCYIKTHNYLSKDNVINHETINEKCKFDTYKGAISMDLDEKLNRECILLGNEDKIIKNEAGQDGKKKYNEVDIAIATKRKLIGNLYNQIRKECKEVSIKTKPEGNKNKRERKNDKKKEAAETGCPISFKYKDKDFAKLERDCETKSAEVYSKLKDEEADDNCKDKVTELKTKCEEFKKAAAERKKNPEKRLCKHNLVKEEGDALKEICRKDEEKYDQYKDYLSVENNKDCDEKEKTKAEEKRKLCVSQHRKSIKNEKKRDKEKEIEKTSGNSRSTDYVSSNIDYQSDYKPKSLRLQYSSNPENIANVNPKLLRELKNTVCNTTADNILPNATEITRSLIEKLHEEICG